MSHSFSGEYEARRREVRRILREASSCTSERIEEILHAEGSWLEQRVKRSVENLTKDICEDRIYCSILGIDYSNLTSNDFKRIMVVALYLDRKYPDHILPKL